MTLMILLLSTTQTDFSEIFQDSEEQRQRSTEVTLKQGSSEKNLSEDFLPRLKIHKHSLDIGGCLIDLST